MVEISALETFLCKPVPIDTIFPLFPLIFTKVVNFFLNFQKFRLVYILSFQKIYICPKKILNTSKLFKEMWSKVPLFQQISTLETNFSMEISNFQIQISIIWSTNNLSKTLICIKIVQQMAEISFKKGWKTCETSNKSWFSNGFFKSIFARNTRF